MIKMITAKLGKMRKAVEWVVYPHVEGCSDLWIQSDHRFCRIDPISKRGVLSAHVAGHPSNSCCRMELGATYVDISDELLDTILAAKPKSGDHIGCGVYIA